MGNDGGSIPTRRELVKNAARLPTVSELKATALEAQTHAWQNDPVSNEPLDLDNAVSDWRGRLYNYETVLRGLMPGSDEQADKKDRAAAAAAGRDLTFADTGIRSIRDVVRLKGKPYQAASSSVPRWQCPVTLKELGPGGKAVYVVPCGHVFSELAVETILLDKLCPECSAVLEPANTIPILPTDASEVGRLRQRMDALRAEGLTHSLKKDKSAGDKKSKKNKRKAGPDGGGGGDDDDDSKKNGTEDGAAPPPKKKEKTSAAGARAASNGIASRINNPLTATLTAKVLAEQEAAQRQRRLAESR